MKIENKLHLTHGFRSVANEISWWSSFHEKESLVELIPPPFMREGKKIGRNDPCTCGSGKKYKKCHGA
jgi:uncharacterized protein YecA (UPF0149 family)